MSTLVRPCVGCGQTDDHPRHVIALPDGNDMYWHNDCHANNGCEVCKGVLASSGAKTGTTGDKLREAIVNNVTPEVSVTLHDKTMPPEAFTGKATG